MRERRGGPGERHGREHRICHRRQRGVSAAYLGGGRGKRHGGQSATCLPKRALFQGRRPSAPGVSTAPPRGRSYTHFFIPGGCTPYERATSSCWNPQTPPQPRTCTCRLHGQSHVHADNSYQELHGGSSHGVDTSAFLTQTEESSSPAITRAILPIAPRLPHVMEEDDGDALHHQPGHRGHHGRGGGHGGHEIRCRVPSPSAHGKSAPPRRWARQTAASVCSSSWNTSSSASWGAFIQGLGLNLLGYAAAPSASVIRGGVLHGHGRIRQSGPAEALRYE